MTEARERGGRMSAECWWSGWDGGEQREVIGFQRDFVAI